MSTMEHCWVGNLADISVSELLEFLHEGGCTAMLRVGAGLDACVVFFRAGQLYRCEWGSRQGMVALAALFKVKEGDFCLIQRQFPEPRSNVNVPTEALLRSAATSPTLAAS